MEYWFGRGAEPVTATERPPRNGPSSRHLSVFTAAVSSTAAAPSRGWSSGMLGRVSLALVGAEIGRWAPRNAGTRNRTLATAAPCRYGRITFSPPTVGDDQPVEVARGAGRSQVLRARTPRTPRTLRPTRSLRSHRRAWRRDSPIDRSDHSCAHLGGCRAARLASRRRQRGQVLRRRREAGGQT